MTSRRRKHSAALIANLAPRVESETSRSRFARRPAASPVFLWLLPVILAISLLFPTVFRRIILVRQRSLPENAPALALDALERGDDASLERELPRALALAPERDASGKIRLMRQDAIEETTLARVYESLAKALASHGRHLAARQSAWKAIRLYHLFERPLLRTIPWEILARDHFAEGDLARGSAVLRIVRAQSATAAAELELLRSRQAAFDLRKPDPSAPRSAVGAASSGDSTLIGYESFRGAATEYFPPSDESPGAGGALDLYRSCAGRVSFSLDRPAQSLSLTASGTSALGIPSIVLVSVDGGEPFPVGIDHPQPWIYPVGGALTPGPHEVTIEYLNDAVVREDSEVEDRNVTLLRFAAERTEAPPGRGMLPPEGSHVPRV